ncbi:DNA double-strand break repair nuclease NurA [Caloramator sp. E03]|uniref:DNA double-strand break repair nuclease NurA n=1 Tax=Caloramator sp. E03 TaxID=2576307 RepID=UPI0011109E68|nr:DNA double-strand break repair nuclease NurA [Caloramator sp. E03]QCX33467.1 DNA double-strand break repair nuclease NurA [Caloramator sp. E03]
MDYTLLKQKLHLIDCKFKDKYKIIEHQKVKSLLFDIVGTPIKLSKLDEKDIEKVTTGNGIVGVDGSINSYGGIYPHYISLIQALAKSTIQSEDILLQDVYVPLFEEDEGQNKDEVKRRALMSKLELEAASQAMDNFKSDIILMDGSLMHYMIDCGDEWERFKRKAILKNKIIIGVTEEVKTRDIIDIIGYKMDIKNENFYDRDILFGILETGEMLLLKDNIKTTKTERGIKSCYIRFSEDPQVAGLDFIEEQFQAALSYCSLIYTLTPLKGRGIPLWLDIVDKEVKISDDMVKALIESTISKDIRERILNPKRSKR